MLSCIQHGDSDVASLAQNLEEFLADHEERRSDFQRTLDTFLLTIVPEKAVLAFWDAFVGFYEKDNEARYGAFLFGDALEQAKCWLLLY